MIFLMILPRTVNPCWLHDHSSYFHGFWQWLPSKMTDNVFKLKIDRNFLILILGHGSHGNIQDSQQHDSWSKIVPELEFWVFLGHSHLSLIISHGLNLTQRVTKMKFFTPWNFICITDTKIMCYMYEAGQSVWMSDPCYDCRYNRQCNLSCHKLADGQGQCRESMRSTYGRWEQPVISIRMQPVYQLGDFS